MDNDARGAADNDARGAAREPGDQAAQEADRVARFLEANPDWLATRTGLYERLSPPRRVHGDALADHMAAMIAAARQNARTVVDAGRAALGLSERVRSAVLALIRSQDVAEWIVSDLPRLLALDAARLCVEAPASADLAPFGGATVPPGSCARLLGPRCVTVRRDADPADASLLHGEAAGLARHDALLRVDVAGMPPMLLALATRDADRLQPAGPDGAGAESALAFLAAALGASLDARIEHA